MSSRGRSEGYLLVVIFALFSEPLVEVLVRAVERWLER